MKVTYIHHSSFLAELEECSLLFDYTEGKLPEIDSSKPLVIFASHRHGDHFSPEIFSVAESHPASEIILSSDISKKRVPDRLLKQTSFLKPNTADSSDRASGVSVETFRSTDEGVAFLVTAGDKTIYHAGDLNNWRWEGEGEQWNRSMDLKYHEELKKLSGRRIDVAFVPLDPRQEQWFYLGMDEFMRAADARAVFPMHFWGDYDVITRMKQLPCTESYRDRIMAIHREGETYNF